MAGHQLTAGRDAELGINLREVIFDGLGRGLIVLVRSLEVAAGFGERRSAGSRCDPWPATGATVRRLALTSRSPGGRRRVGRRRRRRAGHGAPRAPHMVHLSRSEWSAPRSAHTARRRQRGPQHGDVAARGHAIAVTTRRTVAARSRSTRFAGTSPRTRPTDPSTAGSAADHTPNGSDASLTSPRPSPTRTAGVANTVAWARQVVLPKPASPTMNNAPPRRARTPSNRSAIAARTVSRSNGCPAPIAAAPPPVVASRVQRGAAQPKNTRAHRWWVRKAVLEHGTPATTTR